MSETLRPAADWELQGIVAGLAEERATIEVIGSATKRAIGRPIRTDACISTSSIRGTSLYEPSELVMSVRAGTSLVQVEAELAANAQMLAFEPIDLGPTTGGLKGAQTIGAVFAANLSGARRVVAGSARDHLIGVKGVNGRAETFSAGGRVMKNVTGYDVTRALTGSWGTLAILTEVTFKVLPWPEDSTTIVFLDLPDEFGIEVLCTALRLPYEVSGTVHLPATVASRLEHEGLRTQGKALTALRLENFSRSLGYRKQALIDQLRAFGKPLILDVHDTLNFWTEMRHLSVMPYNDNCLWRISTAPKLGPKVVTAIRRHMAAEVFYDWSGGLVWAEVPASADAGASDIRRAVAVHGGHATLIRAAPEVRAAVEIFQPLEPAVERLTRGLKATFDPNGLLNPGRMYATM